MTAIGVHTGQHQSTTEPARNWRLDAACQYHDPELFFPHNEIARGDAVRAQIAAAKAVCATCEVVAQCCEWATETGQAYGIWGGMTSPERHPGRRLYGIYLPQPATAREGMPWSVEEDRRLSAMFQIGHTDQRMATALNRGINGIQKRRRRLGLKRQPNPPKPTKSRERRCTNCNTAFVAYPHQKYCAQPCERQANTARNRHRQAEQAADRRQRLAADPTLAPHAEPSTYRNWGCRCELCRNAEWRHRRRPTRKETAA
jgi:WhiB family redox-sensing transcriptional regulator